ncbi:hypothetical protein SAMN05720766_13221 [Fibrobacter sp. UWH9]|uniref:hypothetical protein n=1 Tax=Fibrobacter sp. UWH9 TaxID=1896213 RepID=UPI0009234D07|nr:hypothetical protein [Fibrobacter sp. UWH9]MDO4948027.1 hypothetical protein [Fibrobacter sp.]SHH88050.1 hypothetical protein SAMN05720766_13221 [Fibrobacter sp. UWH9]
MMNRLLFSFFIMTSLSFATSVEEYLGQYLNVLFNINYYTKTEDAFSNWKKLDEIFTRISGLQQNERILFYKRAFYYGEMDGEVLGSFGKMMVCNGDLEMLKKNILLTDSKNKTKEMIKKNTLFESFILSRNNKCEDGD